MAIFIIQSHFLRPKINLIPLKIIFALEHQIRRRASILVKMCSIFISSQQSCFARYQKTLAYFIWYTMNFHNRYNTIDYVLETYVYAIHNNEKFIWHLCHFFKSSKLRDATALYYSYKIQDLPSCQKTVTCTLFTLKRKNCQPIIPETSIVFWTLWTTSELTQVDIFAKILPPEHHLW